MPSLLDILGYAGNLLDLPGSSVRDLLSGNNPFDQWATPFSSDNRASGRDVLRPFLGENEETGMSGWVSNPMEGVKDIAGFGLEMVADPLNFVSLSPLWRALKGRKAVKGANAAQELANRGRYGYVNAKLLNAAEDVAPEAVQHAGPKLIGYTPAPENPMFPGRELVHHGGHDWSPSATSQHPYGMYDTSRAGIGEGGQMYGPGFYVADDQNVSNHYRDIVQEDLNAKSPLGILKNAYTDSSEIFDDSLDVANDAKLSIDGPFRDEMRVVHNWLQEVNWLDHDITKPNDIEILVDGMLADPREWEFIEGMTPSVKTALTRMLDEGTSKANLYKLDMPAGSKERFMKWEAPLSDQPKAVQDLVDDPQKLISPEQWKSLEQAQEYSDTLDELLARQLEISRDPSLTYLAPIVNEQLTEVRDLLSSTRRGLLDQKVPWDLVHGRFEDINKIDGETIADLIMGNQPYQATLEEASGLRKAGVPGMANEAMITPGTRNYAIWDQDFINQMRIREINGERVPINPMLGPITQVEKTTIPQIADSPLTEVINPMSTQPLPGLAKPAMQGAAYQALARFNTYGGSL